MSRRSLVSSLALLAIISCSPACVMNVEYEVDPGDHCTHEMSLFGNAVCPAGYQCDDTKNWTCQPNVPATYPSSMYAPPPVDAGRDAARHTSDASASIEDAAAPLDDDASDADR